MSMDRKTLESHKKMLIEKTLEQQFEYGRAVEKALLTLSGGALALSITFIYQIAHSPRYLWLLWVAWPSFIISIIMILISFFASYKSGDGIVKMIYAIGEEDESDCNKKTFWDKCSRVLVGFSIMLFVIGLCLLTIFCVLNLPQKEQGRPDNAKSTIQAPKIISGPGMNYGVEKPGTGVVDGMSGCCGLKLAQAVSS